VTRIGSLFSGIGGLELGLERAELGTVAWHCEADPHCRAVLAARWPDVPCFPDVRELRGVLVEPVEILSGGFPCQDLSLAGLGKGLDGERSGLWSQMKRLVEELRPQRVVAENDDFLAVTPYASRFSFETWILPKAHNSHFEDMPGAAAQPLAEIIKTVLSKLSASLPDLSYNLIVHTMPPQDPAAGHYHWHIEIMPKLTHVAGFEWGTGFYINTVSPEDAADMLNSGKRYEV